ncbi:response regulator transcription factor [Teredinibacter sp. KSP-S5-2]|uniref:response regulator transcription factor n=1 Tax=Teredinibacter sp. KSP-S5-2 TaxID=3034506 RepID=UPI002934F1A6|nr:response regulator transcription factor [Teredinibacter sp. KSP-S5-2]WNO09948.1 response regulator transcription factor [Teredinibacter sp. KSP-S5-2]
MRALLVEDDNDLRKLMADELALFGIQCTEAGNAIEFYQQLALQDYSSAIVDIGLPDQNGLEITAYLRQHTSLGIVILSALGTEDDRIRGYQAGADIYFVKPVTGAELACAIHNLAARVALRTAPPKDHWILDCRRWSLNAPNGNSYGLNVKERRFLKTLLENPGQPTEKSELLKKLGYLEDRHGQHALESMVMRLRKKIRCHMNGAPIKTIRGLGYQFIPPFKAVDS